VRIIIVGLSLFIVTFIEASEPTKIRINNCEKAVNKNTRYRVSGIFGSTLEKEHKRTTAFIFLKELLRFKVLKKEFKKKTDDWIFEFMEMIGGKIIVFVYHTKIHADFCSGTNSFFVIKK